MKLLSINDLCLALRVNRRYIFDLSNRVNVCYRSYDISKKNSSDKRHIDAPNSELKNIQRKINEIILKPMVASLPDYMHGSRVGKSIKTNAEGHVNKETLLSLDIKNCFPSITYKRVYYAFRRNGCSKSVSKILTTLTTKNGVLPQGCPTSSSICNLVLVPLIQKMHSANQEKDIHTSQYVDDLFFSGNKKDIENIIHPMMVNIWHFGLRPNTNKISLQHNSGNMHVANAVVNKKVSAGRKKIRAIEREIMRVTKKDALEYRDVLRKRKRQDFCVISCKIEKIYGKISNVSSLNKQQGIRLKAKIDNKIKALLA